WALGVLCHELCAGAHPFTMGETPKPPPQAFAADGGSRSGLRPDEPGYAPSPTEGARRIRSGPPAPPPPSRPAPPRRAVSPCLAQAPEDRFPDAAAAAAAFEEVLGSLSRLPVPVLVSRALEAAGKGEALPAPGALAALPRAKAVGIDVPRVARDLAVISALI